MTCGLGCAHRSVAHTPRRFHVLFSSTSSIGMDTVKIYKTKREERIVWVCEVCEVCEVCVFV